MDFDLSMPAVAIALWVLGGVLYSETKTYAEKQKVFTLPAMVTISIALVICVLLTYPAWREYKSCYLVKEGDYALHMGYYPRAIDKYEEAFELSPLSGGIAAKLAQSYAGRVQSSSENDYNEKFNYYVDKTHSLHPWSEVSSWNLIDAFKLKGDRLQRLEEEERYVSIVPSWVPGIERLAEGYLAEGLTKLESGNVAEAEKYFELCYEMIERINENYLQSGKKSNMKVTPKGYTLAGESALLLNNTEDAVIQLIFAEKYSQTKPLAQTLLALAYKDIDEQKHMYYYDQYVRNSADNTAVYDRYKNLLEKTGG
jgi:tetratricopeptide (TPR) repeat protein